MLNPIGVPPSSVDAGIMFEDESLVTLGVVTTDRKLQCRATDSKVGGKPVWYEGSTFIDLNFSCLNCCGELEHVFTLYAPIEDDKSKLDRSLYIFACPQPSCCLNSCSWRVLRDQREVSQSSSSLREVNPKKVSYSWDFLREEIESGQENDDLAYLESLLERKTFSTTDVAPSDQSNRRIASSSNGNECDGWLVASKSEPMSEELSNEHDKHISSMVQKYLDDEDDDAVRHLVREHFTIEPKASGWTEDDAGEDDYSEGDEGINKADIRSVTEMRFLRRVSLEPRQVVRYAYGGKPLWCTHPSPPEAREIPSCPSCGSPRVFEAQLMPGALMYLHRLDAFKTCATEAEEGLPPTLDSRRSRLKKLSGFDFGTLAVWSCAESCSAGREEYCVVQPPSDDF